MVAEFILRNSNSFRGDYENSVLEVQRLHSRQLAVVRWSESDDQNQGPQALAAKARFPSDHR